MRRTPGLSSNLENEPLRRKHASKTEIDKDSSQDFPFQSSKMNELGQRSTPLGVVNETLDDIVITNGDGPDD